MELRAYQLEAVQAVYSYLQHEQGNPVVCAPTGSGKSLMLAQIVKDAVKEWNGRVLLVAHVKELLIQDFEAIESLAPDIQCGIYSAGLGSKDAHAPVVIAGIQSAYRNARELGRFDLILVDEVHRVPDEGDGQYRTLLKGLQEINPDIRMIGFSATPYRTGTGPICGPDKLFTKVCFDISIRQLIVGGYLCKLVSKTTRLAKVDTSGLHVRAGEFVQEEVEALMNDEHRIALAALEIGEKCEARKSVLVFCSGIDHARKVAQAVSDITGDLNVRMVFGDTPDDDRDRIVREFKRGEIKYLINVGVYTTGFDAACCDCVVLLRPTASECLYVQMVGRGFRIHPGKQDCLILDFGGNVLRHGPVDMIQPKSKGGAGSGGGPPVRECPACQSVIAAGYKECPDCGCVFPAREVKHDGRPGDADVISNPDDYKLDVEEVQYAKHLKGGDEAAIPTLRVEYHIVAGLSWISEWICFEHVGFARDKAANWWRKRSDHPVPATVQQALDIIQEHGLKEPLSITYKPEGKYRRIIGWHDLGVERTKKEADGG